MRDWIVYCYIQITVFTNRFCGNFVDRLINNTFKQILTDLLLQK